MDFDDLFPEPSAAGVRAGGKFQPKAKSRPKKGASIRALTQDNGKTDPKDSSTLEAMEPEVNAENQSNFEMASHEVDKSWLDMDTGVLSTSQSSENHKYKPQGGSDQPEFSVTPAPIGLEDCLVVDGENCGDPHLSSEKNVDIFIGLDSLDDFLTETTDVEAFATGTQISNERVSHDLEGFPEASLTEDSAAQRNSTMSEIDKDNHNQAERSHIEERGCIDLFESQFHSEAGLLEEERQMWKIKPNPRPNDQIDPSQVENVQGGSAYSGLEYNDIYTETSESPPSNFTIIDAECCAARESESRRDHGKSKEPVAEKEGSVRRQKIVNDAPDQSYGAPQKKFKHSTRRKRRSVNKQLLETPDEEVRFLAIKDMLRIADYKEWLEKKEAKELGISSRDKGTQRNSHGEELRNGGDMSDVEHSESQESIPVQSSAFVLNYQSYMRKEPRSKWSKQDTQLFYEGIRQFGSDLSMIQQLFPEKSRHQIKLKYKKEERQHPLKLSEALANRAKDHSHFETVIERLRKVAAAQAEEQGIDGEVAGMPAKGVEPPVFTNIKGTNCEAGTEVKNADEVPEEVLKASEDEDNDEIWSSYQSEF